MRKKINYNNNHNHYSHSHNSSGASIGIYWVIGIIILLAIILYLFFNGSRHMSPHTSPVGGNGMVNVVSFLPSYPYNNLGSGVGGWFGSSVPQDVLMDPYAPPLSDQRYITPKITVIPAGTTPINISSNIGAVDTNYRQMGILNPLNGKNKDNILPLMGRPLFTSRSKWQYYTISNQHNNVKLPVLVKGRGGLSEYGVDEIYNGDSVYVEGLGEIYKTTIYQNDTIKYLPF